MSWTGKKESKKAIWTIQQDKPYHPIEAIVGFLKKKGLNEDEIKHALKATGTPTPHKRDKTMKKEKPVRSIGLDTAIMPDVVAESVVEKAMRLANLEMNDRDIGYYTGRLVEQAEGAYQTNSDFRKKIRGPENLGRDTLYVFMQHWISSMLLKDTGNRRSVRLALIDSGFSMGRNVQ